MSDFLFAWIKTWSFVRTVPGYNPEEEDENKEEDDSDDDEDDEE